MGEVMLKRILVTWLTSQIVGPRRSLRQTARRSVRRKVTYYRPKNMARRSVRRALKKLL
jgi:hypothetical protein